MTVGRITFGPAEPYSAPDLRRRGSVRGFDPAALAPTPSPEINPPRGESHSHSDSMDALRCHLCHPALPINPPREIAPVQEWRIVPRPGHPATVNGIMPPVCFVPRADFEGLPAEWPADTAWKTPMETK
mgnify:CR=1 FL=1